MLKEKHAITVNAVLVFLATEGLASMLEVVLFLKPGMEKNSKRLKRLISIQKKE